MVCSRDLHLWGALLQPQNHPQQSFLHLPPQNGLGRNIYLLLALSTGDTHLQQARPRENGEEKPSFPSVGKGSCGGEKISWDHQRWTGCWQNKGSVGDAQSCASLVLPALAFLSVPKHPHCASNTVQGAQTLPVDTQEQQHGKQLLFSTAGITPSEMKHPKSR